jgi:hypothetical protein
MGTYSSIPHLVKCGSGRVGGAGLAWEGGGFVCFVIYFVQVFLYCICMHFCSGSSPLFNCLQQYHFQNTLKPILVYPRQICCALGMRETTILDEVVS